MTTDVSVAQVDVTGTAYAARTRVRGLLVMPGASAGSVVLTDGGLLGSQVMDITTAANGEPFSVVIPADGVLFENDVHVAVTNAKALVFYG